MRIFSRLQGFSSFLEKDIDAKQKPTLHFSDIGVIVDKRLLYFFVNADFDALYFVFVVLMVKCGCFVHFISELYSLLVGGFPPFERRAASFPQFSAVKERFSTFFNNRFLGSRFCVFCSFALFPPEIEALLPCPLQGEFPIRKAPRLKTPERLFSFFT
jgi:hypothetical protein